jgi:hypothetical protein
MSQSVLEMGPGVARHKPRNEDLRRGACWNAGAIACEQAYNPKFHEHLPDTPGALACHSFCKWMHPCCLVSTYLKYV